MDPVPDTTSTLCNRSLALTKLSYNLALAIGRFYFFCQKGAKTNKVFFLQKVHEIPAVDDNLLPSFTTRDFATTTATTVDLHLAHA